MLHSTIFYTQCPVCSTTEITKELIALDHTVSKETFDIWHCNRCSLRFTQSIPDAAHIGPYYNSANYVSHSDTQKGLIYRCYHLVRNFTLQRKRKLVQAVTNKKNGSLLDVGAGTGAFLKVMQHAEWQVTGLEPDDTARKNALEINSVQLLAPETLYELAANKYDAITMWHVLEHVHDLQGYLKQFHQILQANGKLIIAVPNYTSYDAQVYGADWAAYDVPRHLYHFSPESMEVLADARGFKIDKMLPMWFDSFYVSMLSEQIKYGKNHIISAVWNGLVSNIKALLNNKKASSIIYILSKK